MANRPLVAIDFKKIGTPGYRSYRILQSAGLWAQVYRERIARCGTLRSAIIFPEQLLGLNQSTIYGVSVKIEGRSVGVSGFPIHSWNLKARVSSYTNTPLLTPDEIFQFEYDNSNSTIELENLLVNDNNQPFVKHGYLFTNKADAAKFAAKTVEAGIRGL